MVWQKSRETTNASRIFILNGPLYRLVFYKLELQANTAIGTVEERPELAARDIVLHIARVPVICNVEDCKPRTPFVLFAAKLDLQSLHHEHVERHQLRKACPLVAWSNKILLLVHD